MKHHIWTEQVNTPQYRTEHHTYSLIAKVWVCGGLRYVDVQDWRKRGSIPSHAMWCGLLSTFASCDHGDAAWGTANAEDVCFLEEWDDKVCPFP